MKRIGTLKTLVLVFLLASVLVLVYHDGSSLPLGAVTGDLNSRVVSIDAEYGANATIEIPLASNERIRSVKAFGEWNGSGSAVLTLEAGGDSYLVYRSNISDSFYVNEVSQGLLSITGNVVLEGSTTIDNTSNSSSTNDGIQSENNTVGELLVIDPIVDANDSVAEGETAVNESQNISFVIPVPRVNQSGEVNASNVSNASKVSNTRSLNLSNSTSPTNDSSVNNSGSANVSNSTVQNSVPTYHATELRSECVDTCSLVPAVEGPAELNLEINASQVRLDYLIIVIEEVLDAVDEDVSFVKGDNRSDVPSKLFIRQGQEWQESSELPVGLADLRLDVDHEVVEEITLTGAILSTTDQSLLARIGLVKITNTNDTVDLTLLTTYENISIAVKNKSLEYCPKSASGYCESEYLNTGGVIGSGYYPKFSLKDSKLIRSSEVEEYLEKVPIRFETVDGSIIQEMVVDEANEVVIEEVSSPELLLAANAPKASVRLRGLRAKANVTAKIGELTSSEEVLIGSKVFGVNNLEVDSATITLPKVGNVSSILHCTNFSVTSFSCPKWVSTNISFIDLGDVIEFNVSSFSAYAGGELVATSAQVAYQNISVVGDVSTTVGDDSQYVFEHEVVDSQDSLLVVAIALEDPSSSKEVETVTYNNISLTLEGVEGVGSNRRQASIWYLENPPSGTNDVSVTIEGGQSNPAAIAAITFSGVNQTDPLFSTTGRESRSRTAFVSYGTTSPNMKVALVAADRAITSVGSGQSELARLRYPTASSQGGMSVTTKGESVLPWVTWRLSNRDDFVAIGSNLRAAIVTAPQNVSGNATLEILDEKGAELPSSLSFVENLGRFQKVRLNVSRMPHFKDIIINGLDSQSSQRRLRFANRTARYKEYLNTFAIDPEELAFDTMNITIENATGNLLLKCTNFNFENNSCNSDEDYELVDLRLTPGESYSFMIDPVDPGFAEAAAPVDIDVHPVDNDTFVVAYVDTNDDDVSFSFVNTNGTIEIGPIDVDTSLAATPVGRVSVAMINNSDHVITWFDDGDAQTSFKGAIYRGSSLVAGPVTLDADVEGGVNYRGDTAIAPLGDRFALCYVDDQDNDANYFVRENSGAAVAGELEVDANVGPNQFGHNLGDCVAVNSSLWAYVWYDDAGGGGDDITFALVDDSGNVDVAATDIDTNAGPNAQIATTALDNDRFVTFFFDDNANDFAFIITDSTGSQITGRTQVDTQAGAGSPRVAATSIRRPSLSNDYFVLSWIDIDSSDIKAAVYDNVGTQVTAPFSATSVQSTSFSLIDLAGRDSTLQTELCPGTFLLAYTNSSSDGEFLPFLYNGSAWDGQCVIPPQVFLNSPASGGNFSDSEVVELGVNITATYGVSSAVAQVVGPSSFAQNVSLSYSGSGSLYNSSFTMPSQVGQYNVTFLVNDSEGFENNSVTTIFFVIDNTPPQVQSLVPASNTSFAAVETIEIAANVSDFSNVDTVFANVTFPNGTVEQVTLSLASGNKYNVSYVTGAITGQYNVSFFANDSLSNANTTESTFFNVLADTQSPAVFDLAPIDGLNQTVGQSISIEANVTDAVTIVSVQANVTRPDNVTVTISLSPQVGDRYGGFFTPTQVGNYSVRFIAQDSAGNINATELTTFSGLAKNISVLAPLPDAAAPGMQVAVEFVGADFSSSEIITTNSSDIIVGPVVVSNESGDAVSTSGSVLSTVFHVRATAQDQDVEVSISGSPVQYPFKIVTPATGAGNFSGSSGVVTIGNGSHGDRTIGGAIVLDSLVVPAGVTLVVDTTDPDANASNGNQGLLPAFVMVDGPVQIEGTINVSGQAGFDFDDASSPSRGGDGGPGGAGGGAGGIKEAGTGANGGDGFAGGGAAGSETGAGGDGGVGSGTVGVSGSGTSGGNGGSAWYGSGLAQGSGGAFDNTDGNGGGGGAGGSGSPFGIGGSSNADGDGSPSGGSGGGGAGGVNSEAEGGGGGAFATAGSDANPSIDTEPGQGGSVYGSAHLVPVMGGSAGGGGSPDTGGSDERPSGGGGGAGGAVVIFSEESIVVSGSILANGGSGGTGSPSFGGGGGGGGSGGAIIVQSSNTDLSSATLSVAGGAAGTGDELGGAGGDGRVRADGVNGTDVPGTYGSEFIGPAITGFNSSHVIGRASASSTILIDVRTDSSSDSFSGVADAQGNFSIPVSFFSGVNYIAAVQNTSANSVSVISSAATTIVTTSLGVLSVIPMVNISVSSFSSFQIGANITSLLPVDSVIASIAFPNGTVENVTLTNSVGNFYNASYSVEDLLGQYNVTFFANDTVGTVNDSQTTFFNVILDNIAPVVFDLRPQNASTFSTGTTIELSANITDQTVLTTRQANVTFPSGASELVTLVRVPSTDKYNTSYFIPEELGIFTVRIIATDSGNNTNNTETTQFTTNVDGTPPTLFNFVPANLSTQEVGETIEIGVDATDLSNVSVILVNITYPNGTTIQDTLVKQGATNTFNTSFTLDSDQFGTYNVTYIANDTLGNTRIVRNTFGTDASFTFIENQVNQTFAFGFSNGTLSNVVYNTQLPAIELTASQTSGTYTSEVFTVGSPSQWINISFEESAYGPLPDNGVVETDFASKNANMSGNIVLLHADEAAGSTTFEDSSGNSNNFTCTNPDCPNSSVGRIDNAFDFNGSGQYVVDSNASNYISNLSAFTVLVWVNSNVDNSDQGIFQGAVPSGSDSVIGLRYDAAGANSGCSNCIKAGLTTTGGGATEHQIESSSDTQKIGWQHLALTWSSGNDLALFIDGVEDTGADILNPGLTGTITGSTALHIGVGAKGTLGTAGWDGLIDEFVLFDRVLSDQEISDFYARGAASLDLKVRSCDDVACVGESFIDVPDVAQSLSVANNSFFQYEFDFTSLNESVSPELYNVSIAIFEQDVEGPNVTLVNPQPATIVNVSQVVTLSVNVTDRLNSVDVVVANVTYPNGSIIVVPLSVTGAPTYEGNFTVPGLIGQYNITFIANDTLGNVNASIVSDVNVIFVPVLGFTLTLPGQPATNASVNSTATAVMFFNSSVQTFSDMHPCVKGTSSCQNSTLPFFQYLNTGNLNLSLAISLDSELPPQLALTSNGISDPGSSLLVNSTPRNIASNIAPAGTLDQWFYGDFINAYPSDSTVRNLTSNGTQS